MEYQTGALTRPAERTRTQHDSLYITVTIGGVQAQRTVMPVYEGSVLNFGSSSQNELSIPSNLLSRNHGRLLYRKGRWYYADMFSTNGTILNNHYLHYPAEMRGSAPHWHAISIPCVLRVDNPKRPVQDKVEIMLGFDNFFQTDKVPLHKDRPCVIGRSEKCDICIPHVSVSRKHAVIRYENGSYVITDNHSTNGLTVNSSRVTGSRKLRMNDVIRVGRTMIVFLGNSVEVIRANSEGVSISARGVYKYVYERDQMQKKKKILLHNVSLDIQPGELVAIIGGSGAGKTTLMNVLSKFTEKQEGHVIIDGQNLDTDYASIKDMIGYVPQQDIVYEQLPLYKMLDYAARMRMPNDTTPKERDQRIMEVLELVQLTEHRNSLISKLSGGQKKRASIAVELLADPSLFFLDEPTSGLDAGTEEKLMHSLRDLARKGKTVILVTHSTLKLNICDRIIAMGRGGRLCFSGNLQEAMDFFKVKHIPEIYEKLDNESERWESRFSEKIKPSGVSQPTGKSKAKKGISTFQQYGILTSRYSQIMMRNQKQLMGIIGQAIIFAFVLVLVSKDNLYVEFQGTQTVNFVSACLGMWMGLFLAIQEITKERGIVRREYMANLKRVPYLMSKVTVLGVLAAVQTFVMQFCSFLFSSILDKNTPDNSLILPCYIENGVTIFLVALASVCMGLMISALVKQPERIAPYVLMPQIVLSGVLFDLGGAFEYIKWLVFTYWGNRALCASADVNQLGINQLGERFETVSDYSFEVENLLGCWGALLLLAAIMIFIAFLALKRLSKDERG